MDEQLVPIGRFSEATRLSVKALRHYDDIGLLRPAVTDPQSGYRYYRLGQANRAEAIRQLRGVDMPLDDIAEVLDAEGDTDRVHKVLDAHHGRLADELARHERMLAFLGRLLTDQEHLMPYEITHETVPDRTIASVRLTTDLDEIGQRIGPAFGQVMTAIGTRGATPGGMPMTIFHDVLDDDTPGEVEVAIPVAGEPVDPVADVAFAVLPGGEVAATIHHGPYHQVGPAYHALTDWIAEHGHQVAGPPRESYLNDPQEVAEEDLLTRVEWPVR